MLNTEFSRIVQKLGKNISIKSVHLAKVGCLYFTSYSDDPYEESLPISKLEELQQGVDNNSYPSYSELINQLQKHPNIFEVKAPIDKDDEDVMLLAGPTRCNILQGSPFSLRVHIPENQRRYNFFSKHESAVTDFYVASTGSIYCTYVSANKFPFFTSIGQEYREVVCEQTKKDWNWHAHVIGPTPCHIDFYFIESDDLKNSAPQIIAEDWNVYVFIPSTDIHEFMRYFIREISFCLSYFYSRKINSLFAFGYQEEIQTLFKQLAEVAIDLNQTSKMRLLKHANITKKGSFLLSKIHKRMVEFEDIIFSSEREQHKILDRIKESEFLGSEDTASYFEDTLETRVQLSKTLHAALQHFENEFNFANSQRSSAYVSVIAAVISASAAIYTALFAGLF